MRLYSADTQTWEHRDRALAAGHPGAIRWEAMSVEERLEIEPEEALEVWIHWERGPMIVDDLRTLPRTPLIVAEGTTLLPDLVDRENALWLEWPTAVPDDPVVRHFAAAIMERAREHGIPVLTVDASVEETIEAVEEHFSVALAKGPRAESVDERRALLRESNEALVFQVRTGIARPWATGDVESVTRDFLCECDDPECREVLVLAVADFERRAAAGRVLAHRRR